MNPELARRIAFTLGALLVYRFGTHIPLPGINPAVWQQLFSTHQGGLLGMADTASGGAIARLAVFALGITPFVTAAVIVQLVTFVVPPMRALRDAGERGRRAIDLCTWLFTLFVAAFQSYGMAHALESVSGLVSEPGAMFRLATIFTLTGGTLFLTWLAGQITRRGIGNGIALILCAGIVAELPRSILAAFELGRRGVLSDSLIVMIALLAVVLVVLVTVMEKARRLEPVEFLRRNAPPNRATLEFKLNGAGVVPALIATWLLTLPLAIIAFLAPDAAEIARAFSHGTPLYTLCYAVLIFVCAGLYAALVLDPTHAAEQLQRYGGAIPGIAPGEATADHLDGVLSGATLIGATYFVTVCLIPELLISWAQVPFYLGGTSLLVLVCTVLDLETEVSALSRMKQGG